MDDEHYIRKAVIRTMSGEFKALNVNIKLQIIEANNGLECILALYFANISNIKIDAIISDETMPFISGSYSSKIIKEMIEKGILKNVKMFVSTSLSESNTKDIYSQIVNKVYSKPLDKTSAKEIINIISS